MAGHSAADRIVHPLPKSLVRDASWGSLFLAICVWWLFIGCKHLVASKLSLSFDYQGQPCGSKAVPPKYLYYPLSQADPHALATAGLHGALNLAEPICVARCPGEQDVKNKLELRDVSPISDKIYGQALTAQRVYPAEPYGDFLCVPQDRAIGAQLLAELKISTWGFKIWSLVNSISAGAAFWTLLASCLVSLLAAPAICLVLVLDIGLTHILTVLVLPTLTVVLVLLANKMNLFTQYTRLVMASGITITTLLALAVCMLSALTGYTIYITRARHNVNKAVLKIYSDAARCIPGLFVVPVVASFLGFATIFLSIKTSASVLITTHRPIPFPVPQHRLGETEAPARLLLSAFTPVSHHSDAQLARQPLAHTAHADFATQLGLEIGQMLKKPAEGQTPTPFEIGDDLVGGAALSKRRKDAEQLHVEKTPPASPSPKQPSAAPKLNNLYPGVQLQVRLLPLASLAVYVVCCILLLECIISISNTFVAAWTTVWYYSPPEIGGNRCVEASAIRYASLTTFSSHFANIFTTSAINAVTRPITFCCSLLTSIPAVLKWWLSIYEDDSSIIATAYQLCSCASSVTIAHSLIHGYHLLLSTKTLINEDLYTQSVRRILRLGALTHQQVTVLLMSTISAILTASTCAFTPAFTQHHHDFYVNVPMLTAAISFAITFYLTSTLTSSIVQSIDCLICCYQFERQTGSSAAYTPDEFTIIHTDVRKAAQEISDTVCIDLVQELETPTFMKHPSAPILGYQSDQTPSESSALCKLIGSESSSNDPDAIAMYLQDNGSLTFN